jgi:hypothetical protein
MRNFPVHGRPGIAGLPRDPSGADGGRTARGAAVTPATHAGPAARAAIAGSSPPPRGLAPSDTLAAPERPGLHPQLLNGLAGDKKDRVISALEAMRDAGDEVPLPRDGMVCCRVAMATPHQLLRQVTEILEVEMREGLVVHVSLSNVLEGGKLVTRPIPGREPRLGGAPRTPGADGPVRVSAQCRRALAACDEAQAARLMRAVPGAGSAEAAVARIAAALAAGGVHALKPVDGAPQTWEVELAGEPGARAARVLLAFDEGLHEILGVKAYAGSRLRAVDALREQVSGGGKAAEAAGAARRTRR